MASEHGRCLHPLSELLKPAFHAPRHSLVTSLFKVPIHKASPLATEHLGNLTKPDQNKPEEQMKERPDPGVLKTASRGVCS
jgi:hypothetical protein